MPEIEALYSTWRRLIINVVKIITPSVAPVFNIFSASICAEPAMAIADHAVLCQTLMPALTLNAPTINENGKSPMHRGIIALAPRKMTFYSSAIPANL